MTSKEALKLIKGLACLRDYPKGYPDAEGKLADRLMQASGGDLKLATAIVERFEEKSPTLADISEVARELRGIMAAPANGFQEYEKPEIVCHTCKDAGVIDGPAGYAWCTCDQAVKLRDEIPNWLDTMNKFKAAGKVTGDRRGVQ